MLSASIWEFDLEYIFIDHAKEQMQERNISEGEAISIINNRDDFYIQINGRHVAVKTIRNRKISIIYEPPDKKNGITTIVTAKFKKVKNKKRWNDEL